jgi:hypothetical protein
MPQLALALRSVIPGLTMVGDALERIGRKISNAFMQPARSFSDFSSPHESIICEFQNLMSNHIYKKVFDFNEIICRDSRRI